MGIGVLTVESEMCQPDQCGKKCIVFEILGLANNEEIKVNRVSNDDGVGPFDDEATLLSDENSIFENIGTDNNHSEQSEFQEEALLSGGSEKGKRESKTTTKGNKTQDDVILRTPAIVKGNKSLNLVWSK